MIEIPANNMAPLMFASLIVVLLLGYPVAFARLPPTAFLYGLVGIELGLLQPSCSRLAAAHLGRDVERHAAGSAVFTFMGLIPSAAA
jgi:TRAP-type mannitol/chloroaromatic compound transport system permease large subunit